MKLYKSSKLKIILLFASLGFLFAISSVVLLIFISSNLSQKSGNDLYGKESGITSDPYSIHIRTNITKNVRQVIVPVLNITFDVPTELSTGQELHSSIQDSNRAATQIHLYRNDTKYTKDSNGYDVADNTIVFSFDFNYGDDITFGPDEYVNYYTEGPGNKILTDNLSFDNSILQKRAVNFYNYLDNEHLRSNNQHTLFYKGKLRMDLLTADHTDPTIGLVFGCYDQASKDLCQRTFQLFISSIKLHSGKLKSPPPTYTEKDIFSLIPSAIRNFDLDKNVSMYDNNELKTILVPYYKSSKVQDLIMLKDNQFHGMQCMPDQLFLFQVPNLVISPAFGLQVPANMQDQRLKNIISIIQSPVSIGNLISQFIACKVDDGRYVVKYNQVTKDHPYITKDDTVYAKIEIIDKANNLIHIADIPNKASFCNHFLELTKENILYFECTSQENNIKGSNIYKIDLTAKNYSLISSCLFPMNGEEKDIINFCH